MNEIPVDFELSTDEVYLAAWADGLDTVVTLGHEDAILSWVEAQQLYRWLKARLSE